MTNEAKAAGDEAMRAMGPMLAEIRAVMYLDDDNPRRQAAMVEKLRVLALIEKSKERPTAGVTGSPE